MSAEAEEVERRQEAGRGLLKALANPMICITGVHGPNCGFTTGKGCNCGTKEIEDAIPGYLRVLGVTRA